MSSSSSSTSLSLYPPRFLLWCSGQISSLLGYSDSSPDTLQQITLTLLQSTSQADCLSQAENLFGQSIRTNQFIQELWNQKEAFQRDSFGNGNNGQGGILKPLERGKKKDQESLFQLDDGIGIGIGNQVKSKAKNENINELKSRDMKPAILRTHIKYSNDASGSGGGGSKGRGQRVQCPCQGQLHPYLTNCLVCGRVACESEGFGECFYCGSMLGKDGKTIENEEFVQWMKGNGESSGNSVVSGAVAAPATGDHKESVEDSDDNAERLAAGLKAAEAHRDRLLENASRSISQSGRAAIRDLDSDYFDFQVWGVKESAEQREAREVKRLEEQMKRKPHQIDLDIENMTVRSRRQEEYQEGTGMQFVTTGETNPSSTASGDQSRFGTLLNQFPQVQRSVQELDLVSHAQFHSAFTNDTLLGRAREVYSALQQSLTMADGQREWIPEPPRDENGNIVTPVWNVGKRRIEREEDENEEESSSGGAARSQDQSAVSESIPRPVSSDPEFRVTSNVCISLHQPWASLCILGIKRFEGRGWPIPSFRGQLWIASTAREPTEEEIESVEAEYIEAYKGLNPPFPKHYPSRTLLGCVDLIDCLSNDQFQQLRAAELAAGLPCEDSQSGFVFQLENPRRLAIPQTISGQHKLWPLPAEMAEGLQEQLKPVNSNWRIGKEKEKDKKEKTAKSAPIVSIGKRK